MKQRLKHACLYALPLLIVIIHSNFFYTRLAAGEGKNSEPGSSLITISNLSNTPIYAATYCKNLVTSSSKRTSNVMVIRANASGKLSRPSINLKCARRVVFSFKPQELTESLSKTALKNLGSVGIGTTSGGIITSDFYVTAEDGKLTGYSAHFFNAKTTLAHTEGLLRTFYDTELQIALTKSLHYQHNPRDLEVARVRVCDKIPAQEREFITKRKLINKAALEKLLGKRLNGSYIPTIAFVSSGGGTRALISSLGMHVGAEKTGLLDCVTYDVGLSGGSWFVGLWEQSQLSPSAFKQRIQPIIARGIDPTRKENFNLPEIQNILNGLMFRKASQQPVTLVTLWGAMLANHYLSPYQPYSQDIFFSELYDRIAQAHVPFPILAAINGRFADLGVKNERAEWFEFTPIEAGGVGDWLGNANIPMWALGRTFENNKSIDTKAEYDLGQLMGICGSAFAFSMGRAFAESVGKISMPMAYTISKAIGKELIGTARLSVGKIPNFTKSIPGSIVKEYDDLRLVDGGMAFNIPIPSVIHPKRKADIIIIMDASGSVIGKALQKAEIYANHHKLPLPSLNYNQMETQALNIFESNTPNIPTLIHLSRVVDRKNVSYPSSVPKDYSTKVSTLKFQYTANEFNHLSDVTEANLVHSLDAIKKAITKKIELHNGFAH